MAKKQLHIRLKQSSYDHLVKIAEDNNITLTEAVDNLIIEDKNYSNIKKAVQWSNQRSEYIFEMLNYLTLEMQYRLARDFPPKLSDYEQSMIVKMVDSKRKQERGYIPGRDHY